MEASSSATSAASMGFRTKSRHGFGLILFSVTITISGSDIGLLYDPLHFVVGLRGQGDLRLDNADALPLDLLEHVLEGSGDGGGSVRAFPAPRLVHTPALQFRQRCFDEGYLDAHVHSPV